MKYWGISSVKLFPEKATGRGRALDRPTSAALC